MKRLVYIFSVLLALGYSFPASAVTDKEMEQARTIAAQAYLRYANDGSGYLDNIRARNIAELEKSLKPKERENLKAFKAIPVPAGYDSWNKEKLVDYWAGTAFATKGLVDKGRIGRGRARKRISAMTISAPVKTPEKNAGQSPVAATAQESAKTKTGSAAEKTNPEIAAQQADSVKLAEAEAKLEAVNALELEDEEPLQKAENHTWVYIVILCVLVGIVVALVVFASNVMKKNASRMVPDQDAAPRQPMAPTLPSESSAMNSLREKFAAKLTEKNNELNVLAKKLEETNGANASLKKKIEALSAEVTTLRSRLSEAGKTISQLQNQLKETGRKQAEPAPAMPRKEQSAPGETKGTSGEAAPVRPQAKQPQAQQLRTIYLGRANAKGIFVRADRSLNLGNSIYRLDTSDGYAGSFRVASDPTVWEMALLTPRESLSGACVAPDLDNTDGMEKIVNDASGTAIFENGCWKVIRKAKIHYE